MAIQWDDSLSVNIGPLDEQHKMLISLIQSLQQNSEQEHLSKCLDELIDYCGFHFNDEENYMKHCNYPDLENHMKIHQEFSRKITQMVKDFEKNSLTSATITTFLIDWLLNHIKKIDKQYSLHAQQ